MNGRTFFQALLDSKQLNPHALAQKLKIPTLQSTLQRFLDGKTKEARRSTFEPVAKFFRVSLDGFYNPEIATQELARLNLIPGHQTASNGLDIQPKDSSEVVIPQYDAGGGMGNGLVLEEKQPGLIKSWSVDQEWLRLNVRHHTGVNNLCIVTGFGPSMQPKYNPGDPLLLDRGVTTVETEGIFFFRVGKHGYIKQLQRIPTEDGLIIRAKSLNTSYDPFDITAKMDFEVFGKVLTVWRSEQV